MHDVIASDTNPGSGIHVEMPFGISVELAQAFVDSKLGLKLNDAFPVGSLDRGQMVVLAAWRAKFAPEIRKRKSKHRRKK